MKVIHYGIIGKTDVYNLETETVEQQEVICIVTLPWSDENEERAKREAYNGEITVEDDGEPDPVPADDDEYADMASAIREGVNGI